MLGYFCKLIATAYCLTGQGVQVTAFKVFDSPASDAHKVVMIIRRRELIIRVAMPQVDFADQTHFLKHIQYAIYGDWIQFFASQAAGDFCDAERPFAFL